MPVYIEGVWYPGWLIAIVPFLTIGIIWFKAVIKKINIIAFLISLILNLTMYILFEYNAIMRGHWVYNEQRLLGWRFAGTIPLEQIILYFVSFLFLVPFFESVRFLLISKVGTLEEKQKYAEEIDEPLSFVPLVKK
jgi:lycopene cyclase domain-containing protein